MIGTIKKVLSRRKRLKVGWLLLGDINTGSSRIHGINIHNYLIKQGIQSVILQSNTPWTRNLTLSQNEQEDILESGYNILVFQKVFDDSAVEFAKKARQRGIKTLFILSDKHECEMISAVDTLIVTSDFLRIYFLERYAVNAIVIEDAIEVPTNIVKTHSYSDTLQLVWVGHRDNWRTLEMMEDVIKVVSSHGFALKTISNHPNADVPWSLDTVYNEILSGDIGIIPALDDAWGKAKSNNRLTMFMALGLPVVASDIPAYKKIADFSNNFYLARSREEWVRAILSLKDPSLRRAMGQRARIDVINRFSIEVIGRQWVRLMTGIVKGI